MAVPQLDLSTSRRLHLVGVGGAGMSAIATVLAAMGHRVSGSDLKASPVLDRVRAAGVTVEVGHDAANVGDAEVVAVSTAVPPGNPEVTAAAGRGIPVLRRADLLAAVCATRRVAAVSGTHGKTTTSSMLAMVLVAAGFRPSFIIGGDLNEVGAGAAWADGEWLVVEADESDGTFLELGAEAAVVTNVEPDHLDHYGDEAALRAAFRRFLSAAPGPRVVCADDDGARAVADGLDVVTYGTASGARYRLVDVAPSRAGVSFAVRRGDEPLGEVALAVPGAYNARNAVAVLALALELGVPFATAAEALGRFTGVARRFEWRGEAGGVTFVDDYAHLPAEVAAVLDAARVGAWRRVVAVFQPHRYSRTAALWRDFADAFVHADLVVVTDVYPAGEPPRPGVTGKLLVDAVLDAHPDTPVAWLPRRADVVRYLADRLRPGDLCLTLGAGDVTSLPDEVRPLLAAAGTA